MPKTTLLSFFQAQIDLRGLLLVVLSSGWSFGMLLSAWFTLVPLVPLGAGALALTLTLLGWRLQRVRVVGLTLLFLCLGAWRYAMVAPANDAYSIRALIGTAALQVQGEVADDPRLERNSTLITVAVEKVSVDKGLTWLEAHGQIQVQALGATFDDPFAPRYGDTLRLEGALSSPPDYSTPELQASMTFPRLSIDNRGGNPILLFLYQLRTMLAGILLRSLPQPLAALMIALFLSLRTPALKPLLSSFNVTGTAHLVAPSGFKVTLVAGLVGTTTRWLVPKPTRSLRPLLPAERRRGAWRYWLHTLFLILCIALYTMLSGAGAAALRAGLMGMLLVLAPRLKRSYNAYTAMACTALFMSLHDPFVLWDTGFLLSFLGTLGILLFTPIFQYLFHFLERLPLGYHVVEVLAVTLAAQVATLPLLALDFHILSFIALFANLASVPLLSTLLTLGALICLAGVIALPLALICGWLAWPLLWYVSTIISWCAQLPGAYLSLNAFSPLLAWTYYIFLAGLAILLFVRWRPPQHKPQFYTTKRSRRARLLLQGGLALAMLLATSLLAQAAPTDHHLTITLLSNGIPGQGEALLLRTTNGRTALIDEGADGMMLAQTLDTLLPFWQRSLDLLVLCDTSPNNLAGLQDTITRYGVRQVIDGGMLHPTLAYARWRDAVTTHALAYTQVRQGTVITLDGQTTIQVLWPPAHLHNGSNATHDNALILRLLAPGVSALLLNSAALSPYALQTLANDGTPEMMQAQLVQLTGEMGKTFPASLVSILTQANASLLLLTLAPIKQRKKPLQTTTTVDIPALPAGSWEIIHGEQFASLALQTSGNGWNLAPSG